MTLHDLKGSETVRVRVIVGMRVRFQVRVKGLVRARGGVGLSWSARGRFEVRQRQRDRETERQTERDREWSFAIFAVRCYFLLKQGPVSSCLCGGVLHSFSESCLAFWSLLELSLAT